MPGAVCSGWMADDVRGGQDSVRGVFSFSSRNAGGIVGARFLVFHILFDAEDGSVISVNDHIENLNLPLTTSTLYWPFLCLYSALVAVPPTFRSAALMAWGRVIFALVTFKHRYRPVRNGSQATRAEEGPEAAVERQDVFHGVVSFVGIPEGAHRASLAVKKWGWSKPFLKEEADLWIWKGFRVICSVANQK